MFKNLDKVFKFTFKNQVNTGGYKRLTIGTVIFLLVAPLIILLIIDKVSGKDDELKPCGAERVYVVNDATPDTDYNMLNMLGIDGYTDIQYSNAGSVDEAFDQIADRQEKKSLILEFKVDDEEVANRIIIPDNSEIEEDDAKQYDKFLDESGQMVTIIASGISITELSEMGLKTNDDIFNETSISKNESLLNDSEMEEKQLNSEILPIFNMILIFISIMVVYMMVLIYGNGINQSVVMEKSSKLMDTMLVSIQPQALITGKLLGVLGAAFLQVLSWAVALIAGMIVGVKGMDMIHPGTSFTALTFLKSFNELNLFRPINVIIGIVSLLIGILFYASFSAISGSISSTKEEAQSNQSIFVMLLVISFYLVLFFGMKQDIATWLYLVPFTSVMVLPAGISTGSISIALGLAGLLIIIVSSVVLLILAGKLYVMMSLYKGNKVNLSKALKMLAGKA